MKNSNNENYRRHNVACALQKMILDKNNRWRIDETFKWRRVLKNDINNVTTVTNIDSGIEALIVRDGTQFHRLFNSIKTQD